MKLVSGFCQLLYGKDKLNYIIHMINILVRYLANRLLVIVQSSLEKFLMLNTTIVLILTIT
jgi:hypothetical protein